MKKTRAELAAEIEALKIKLAGVLTNASQQAYTGVVDTLTEWRKKLGRARAESLTPERRSAIARKAALARWAKVKKGKGVSGGAR